MSANNRAIIDRANDAFATNDVAALLALCADDFEGGKIADLEAFVIKTP